MSSVVTKESFYKQITHSLKYAKQGVCAGYALLPCSSVSHFCCCAVFQCDFNLSIENLWRHPNCCDIKPSWFSIDQLCCKAYHWFSSSLLAYLKDIWDMLRHRYSFAKTFLAIILRVPGLCGVLLRDFFTDYPLFTGR